MERPGQPKDGVLRMASLSEMDLALIGTRPTLAKMRGRKEGAVTSCLGFSHHWWQMLYNRVSGSCPDDA